MKLFVRKLDNGRILVRNNDSGESKVLDLAEAMAHIQKLLEGNSEASGSDEKNND